jgi:hypothetical protein
MLAVGVVALMRLLERAVAVLVVEVLVAVLAQQQHKLQELQTLVAVVAVEVYKLDQQALLVAQVLLLFATLMLLIQQYLQLVRQHILFPADLESIDGLLPEQ